MEGRIPWDDATILHAARHDIHQIPYAHFRNKGLLMQAGAINQDVFRLIPCELYREYDVELAALKLFDQILSCRGGECFQWEQDHVYPTSKMLQIY
jgi:hypothetical protein